MFDCSERTVSDGISQLERWGLIKLTYQPKAGGGTFRLAEVCASDWKNSSSRKPKFRAPTRRTLLPKDIKVNNIKEKKILQDNNDFEELETKFSIREQKRNRKPWEKKPKVKGKVNLAPLSRDEMVAVGVEHRAAYFDVEDVQKKILLSIKAGNKYNITNLPATVEIWLENGISSGEYRRLVENYQIECDTLSYSTEALKKAQWRREQVEKMGL